MPADYHKSRDRWYVAPMGRLEWLETGLKAAAMLVAYAALLQALLAGRLNAATVAGTQSTILLWMAVALSVAVIDRLQQREVISIAFVVFNSLAHWAMYLLLLRSALPVAPVVAWCVLMIAGDIAKMAFFLRSEFTVRGLPKPVLLLGVFAFVVGYAVVLALAL